MVFKYENPISCPDLDNIRDPFIIRDKDMYYLTGSSPPFWKGDSPGVKLWRSRDLLSWKYLGLIVDSAGIRETAWYKDRFWAPEILPYNGKYYLTVNCRNEKYDRWHSVFIWEADEITGPYKPLNSERPVLTKEDVRRRGDDPNAGIANDGSLFADGSRVYLSFCNRYGIFAYEILLPSCTLVGELMHIVKPSENDWDGKIEAPYIVKCHEKYFCFYSSYTRNYEVGVAVADSVNGPWKKSERNPIITPKPPVTASGHNCIFTGVDGELWTAYHMSLKEDGTERLAIDKIYLSPDGEVKTAAPTTEQQEIKY